MGILFRGILFRFSFTLFFPFKNLYVAVDWITFTYEALSGFLGLSTVLELVVVGVDLGFKEVARVLLDYLGTNIMMSSIGGESAGLEDAGHVEGH